MTVEEATIGWSFVNPLMKAKYGTDSMPETAENVAEEWHISREDQDAFAFRSQRRVAEAVKKGLLAEEIVPVTVPTKKGDATIVSQDEQPRTDTKLEGLAKLKPIGKQSGQAQEGRGS